MKREGINFELLVKIINFVYLFSALAMGSCVSIQKERGLSPELEKKVLQVFRSMDVDGSKTIDKGETVSFW